MMAFAATASKRGARADMAKSAIDIAKALARLSEGTIFELRGEWRGRHPRPAREREQPAPVPRGGGTAKPAPPLSLRPGTRLVREWRGVTHTVLIHADGI